MSVIIIQMVGDKIKLKTLAISGILVFFHILSLPYHIEIIQRLISAMFFFSSENFLNKRQDFSKFLSLFKFLFGDRTKSSFRFPEHQRRSII